jgi:dUTP pyrophosphatase
MYPSPSDLKPRIIELEPGFMPKCSKPGDAGADIKARLNSENLKHKKTEINLKTTSNLNAKGYFIDGQFHSVSLDEPYTLKLESDNFYCLILPGATELVPAGFKIALPSKLTPPFLAKYDIRSRSGLSSKGLVVANSPGTIDSQYRGEVVVSLYNRGPFLHIISHGARIAQGVYSLCIDQSWWSKEEVLVEELDETERGNGGFGSTGVKALHL